MRHSFWTIPALAVVVLAACVSEREVPDYGLAGFDPKANETRAADCLARGGSYETAGLAGLQACITRPADAGQSCQSASDCESACLARSRSCAPVQPLFGCNAILDESGREVTLCVD
ncbi:hypothetical protein [Aquimixticola soesokkakensis]|uniref:hypothetical protein n=1 Tax=Aquimixticola soesokkakensis TaxID=1519096 RepID=UPI001177AC96|nr:hypothetical protein [Aquimixticola soesokkakensis]